MCATTVMEVRQQDEHDEDPIDDCFSESLAAGWLCACTDRQHAELAGEFAALVQPDAGGPLAALHGEPHDDRRDDGALRAGARPYDQQLGWEHTRLEGGEPRTHFEDNTLERPDCIEAGGPA
eukprot:gene14748-biopygen7037